MNTKLLKQNNRLYWLINMIIFHILKFKPRNKKIWIYGAWMGKKFNDNTKYFFEYMNENHKDIRSIWITKDKELVDKLSKLGYEVYYSYSFKGIIMQLKAGVVLYTNSLHDICDYNFTSGAYTVALWHGMPLKRLYLDDNRGKNKSKIEKFLRAIKWKLYSEVRRDLSIACSESTKKSFQTAFNIKENDIVITGQPRNDIFMRKLKRDDVFKFNKDLEKDSKIITYMPTFRNEENNAEKFNEFLRVLVNNTKLNNVLKEQNFYILIKCHFLGQILIDGTDRIFFIKDNEISNVQELLCVSDILVTDYSSCFIDYLLLNRPIIFLAPDKEEYINGENGFYYNYDKLTGNLLATDIEGFNQKLLEIINGDIDYCQSNKYLKDIFNDELNTPFSKNVYEEIIRRIS